MMGLRGAPGGKKKECVNFESQQWRKNVCKNCFRTQSEHQAGGSNGAAGAGNGGASASAEGHGSPTASSKLEGKKEGVRKPPDSPKGRRPVLTRSGSHGDTEASAGAAKPKTPSPREGKKIGPTSPGSRSLRRSPPSPTAAPSPSKKDDPKIQSMIFERSGSGNRPPISSSCTSIDSRYVEELENDFFDLEDKYSKMEKEKEEMKTELEEKSQQQEELTSEISEYKARTALLEKRCNHLEDEIKNYRERLKLPESEQDSGAAGGAGGAAGGAGGISEANAELQQRVDEMEQLCQDLIEENDVLKEEVEEMQREIEEMHDHFQDEDTDTLRELQRELEAANKTCRIFQFKLRKAERRYEQCELERVSLEEKLHRLEQQFYSNDDRAQIRELEDELRMAKEVSVRLHDELEFLEEKRARYEDENSRLKDELGESDSRRLQLENDLGRLKLEMNKLMVESGMTDRGPLQVTDRSKSRLTASRSLSREPSKEEESLNRELESSKERENDLLEQVRFAEEQVKTLKRKLAETEEENEALVKKCNKLATVRPTATRKERLPVEDSSSDSSDSDEANARLQMKFLEQEASVLRKRIIGLERENEQLLKASEKAGVRPKTAEAPALHSPSRPKPLIVVDTAAAAAAESENGEGKELRSQVRRLDRELLRLSGEHAKAAKAQESRRTELEDRICELDQAVRQSEQQVSRLQRRMVELRQDNETLQAGHRRLEERLKKSSDRGRTKLDLKTATKEDLIEEVDGLDDELDDMYELVKKGDAKVAQLEEQVTKFDSEVDSMHAEFARREKELLDYVQCLDQRHEALCEVLDLVSERGLAIQRDLEAIGGGAAAAGGAGNGKEAASPKGKLEGVEKDLAEERAKRKSAEKSLEAALKKAPDGVNRRDNRGMEKLRKELEEKEQALEEKEENLKDLRSRLEQSRRMYDAMKMLVDKGEEDSKATPAKPGAKESQIESSSFKMEIADLKKKLTAATVKSEEAEKSLEKLKKENAMLSEDIKVREDTIFEQDDDLERKNDEIRSLKFYIEEEKTEMARIRVEMSALQEQMQSVKASDGKAIEREFERLKTQLEAREEEAEVLKTRLQERELELGQAEEQAKILADSVRNRDDRIKEKDELIQHINCRLQNREKEMADSDQMRRQTVEKLTVAEAEMKELRLRFGSTEREGRLLQGRLDEAKGAQEKMLKEAGELREEAKRLREELEKAKKEKAAAVAAAAAATAAAQSTAVTQSTPVAAAAAASGASASQVEVRLQGRVKLLNEEVGRLNLAQVSLKIQNEALQRDAMDYRKSYYQLKEQYQAEQDAWESEKSLLEAKSKDKDEQRVATVNLRRALLEATQKVSVLEVKDAELAQELEKTKMVYEREKMELQARLGQFEEPQKVPKVLQKFRTKSMSNEAAWEKERNEYKVRLNSHEKTVLKLRTQIAELEKKMSEERRDTVKAQEEKATELEKENESMKQACIELQHLRQQGLVLRDRVRHLESLQDRERRIWMDERAQLQYRGEEGKVMIDHWLNRLKIAVNDVPKESEPCLKDLKEVLETLKNILDEMEKFKKSRDRSPYVHIRRRGWPEGSGSSHLDQLGGSASDLPYSITGAVSSGIGSTTSISSQPPPLANRSVSMDWSIHGRLRSASPDPSSISVRKLTNFPDPTPGFLVRSRQASNESLTDDYTQRSYTVPHNFQRSSSLAPSGVQTPKEKFFDEYDKKVLGSTDQLSRRFTSTSTPAGPAATAEAVKSDKTTTISKSTSSKPSTASTTTAAPWVKSTPSTKATTSTSSAPKTTTTTPSTAASTKPASTAAATPKTTPATAVVTAPKTNPIAPTKVTPTPATASTATKTVPTTASSSAKTTPSTSAATTPKTVEPVATKTAPVATKAEPVITKTAPVTTKAEPVATKTAEPVATKTAEPSKPAPGPAPKSGPGGKVTPRGSQTQVQLQSTATLFGLSVLERRKLFNNKSVSLDSNKK